MEVKIPQLRYYILFGIGVYWCIILGVGCGLYFGSGEYYRLEPCFIFLVYGGDMILRNRRIYFVEGITDFAIVGGAQYFVESCEGKPYGGEFAV